MSLSDKFYIILQLSALLNNAEIVY